MGWVWAGLAVGTIIGISMIVRSYGGKAANARLRGYGVVVDGDQVKKQGIILGPLAGAYAEVTGVTSRHTVTRVVTVAGALTKKTDGTVVITFTSGQVHTWPVHGAADLRQASTFVARFNAMARQAAPTG